MNPEAKDVSLPAAPEISQTGDHCPLGIPEVQIEVLLKVPAVRAILVRDDVREMAAQEQLSARELHRQRAAQRFVSVIDVADLVEGRARFEVVVAVVRGSLE